MCTSVNQSAVVTLREVTIDNSSEILKLRVSTAQQEYVASNERSIAAAHLHEEAWFRAIYADETPVGFLMLHDENLRQQVRQDDYYFLWRLMVDERFQGLGFGRKAVQLLVEHVRQRPNATALLVSYHPGPDGPGGFYSKLGFVETGKQVGDEVEMRFVL
jgi:diamine N-acetyltransferase